MRRGTISGALHAIPSARSLSRCPSTHNKPYTSPSKPPSPPHLCLHAILPVGDSPPPPPPSFLPVFAMLSF